LKTPVVIIVSMLCLFTTPPKVWANLTCSELFKHSESRLDHFRSKRFNIPKNTDDILALDRKLELEENSMFKIMEANPADRFLEIRELAMRERNDQGDFPFPIFEPVLKRILLDIATRVQEPAMAKDINELSLLIEAGQKLLEEKTPYKQSLRFTFKYLELMDRLFLRLHPEHAGSFHRDNALPVLEATLANAPDIFMYPSFKSVGLSFFVRTRSVPFNIVGLHPSGARPGEPVPFADGYFMKPSEFAWHDIGHIEFMAMRDFDYLAGSFKPVERVVREWDYTRQRTTTFWKSQRTDKDLYDATGLLLFELLHERGYQFSFAVLKAQLSTPKWIEILERKLSNNYYREFHWMNMALFSRLEQARLELLAFVDRSRAEDQMNHIKALHAEHLAQRITHHPKVEYAKGTMRFIEILSANDIRVITGSESLPLSPRIEDLILAQVDPTQKSPFIPTTVSKMNALLYAKKRGATVKIDGEAMTVGKIIIESHGDIKVELLSDLATLQTKSIETLDLPIEMRRSGARATSRLLKRQLFELEQVLGGAERNQFFSFTFENPTQVYFGRVKISENAKISVLDSKDAVIAEFPLAEALIDPIQATDIKNLPKAKFRYK
jgi:hypothetical protein